MSWDPFLIFLNTWTVLLHCVNSDFCLYTVNSCDFIVHALKKKKRWTQTGNPNGYLKKLLELIFPLFFSIFWLYQLYWKCSKRHQYHIPGKENEPRWCLFIYFSKAPFGSPLFSLLKEILDWSTVAIMDPNFIE